MEQGAAFPGVAAGAWPGPGWGRLVCRAAWDETPRARSYLLAPEIGRGPGFEPGQAITLAARIGGARVERCYTISSSAALGEGLVVTVGLEPGGAMSAHLRDALRPGATIEAAGPAGRFGLPARPGPVALLAAGSGVTPMASILASAADRGEDLDAVLVQAARDPGDAIFADLWPRLMRRMPRLRVHLVASRAAGRLDAGRLAALVPDLGARRVLCCGPRGFMAMARAACAAAGVPAGRYLEESFEAGDGATPDAPPVAEAVARRVTLARSGRSFEVAAGQTILQGARAAGVPMPASCGRGMCGTCKCRKLEGRVEMRHEGGIRQREVDAGMILACSSRPETDVILDR